MDWNNEPGFDRTKERYLQLDLEAWLRKHGVEGEGRKQGAANQPATDAVELDGTEAKLLDWVNRRARVCREDVGGHLADLERDLTDLASDQQLAMLGQRVDQIGRDADIALEGKVNEGRNKLGPVERPVCEDHEDFGRFRRDNGLSRQADYSQRGKALWFILGCFTVEVVLNASLLMGVDPFGLLGSSMQMGLISAVNVLIFGVAMGAMLRQRNARPVPPRIGAWLAMVVLVGVVVIFNLAVGHYRDSMQAVVNSPSVDLFSLGNDVVARVLGGPFVLDSFQSYLLALLGFLFFCVASWKWLQRDDPFPDYGRRHRQLDERKARYVAAYDEAQEDLRRVFAEYESKLEDVQNELELKLSKWTDICIRGRHLVEEFPKQLGQYPHDLNYLIGAYRTANRGARSDPPPDHFKAVVELDAEILKTAPAFDPPPERELTDVMERVHGAITALQEDYRRSSGRYPTLEKLLASDHAS